MCVCVFVSDMGERKRECADDARRDHRWKGVKAGRDYNLILLSMLGLSWSSQVILFRSLERKRRVL